MFADIEENHLWVSAENSESVLKSAAFIFLEHARTPKIVFP